MNLLINKIVSSIAQILLFAAIPFIWWCITARKKQSFFKWIGLKRTGDIKKVSLWIVGVSCAFSFFGVLTLYMIRGVGTATSDFTGLGMQAILSILVYGVFNTALPEELLFRGFLLKRVENRFGFAVGNAVQAILFGLMHGVLFFSMIGVIKATLISLMIGALAWFMGYINERKASGSIYPSWIIHAISNIFSGICSAFSIL